ncbi:MAG: hypothetical protein GQ532_06310 [Methylomarinum sp.]|nr:hypothetical protein [Methylomarinum sp.]
MYEYAPQIITTIGLSLDIFGAYLLANEITNEFEGEMYLNSSIGCGETLRPIKTVEFTSWEIKHKASLRYGLSLLSLGFFLQGTGIWI